MRRFLAAALALATLSGCNVAGVRVTRQGLEPIYTAKVEDVVAAQWRAQQATLEAQAPAVTPTPVVYHVDTGDAALARGMADWQDGNARWCRSAFKGLPIENAATFQFASAGYLGPHYHFVSASDFGPPGMTVPIGARACLGTFKAADGSIYRMGITLTPNGYIFTPL